MCRIDGPFGPHSLNEKTDVTERFIQALDEYRAEGGFRKLLEKHFSLSWPHELGDIEKVETALRSVGQVSNPQEKITSFVQSIKGNFGGDRLQIDFIADVLLQANQKRFPCCFAFARDVASEVFPDSIYGFYQCFRGASSVRFEVFVLLFAPSYYGEFCHLSHLLFNDSQIDALGKKKREDLLWAIFDYWFQGDCSCIEHLTNVFAWDVHSSVPSLKTLRFNNSFEYLSAWIKADAQSREHSESLDFLETKMHSFIWNLVSDVSFMQPGALMEFLAEDEINEFKEWSQKWLEDKRHALTTTWCCSVKLENMLPEVVDGWARRAHDVYLPLCPGLSEEQAGALIVWAIDKDLNEWLKPKRMNDSLLEENLFSKLWYISPFSEAWREYLIKALESLSFTDRLRVLSRRFGRSFHISQYLLPRFIALPQQNLKKDEGHDSTFGWYEFPVVQEDRDWWDSLLRSLPEDGTFPKDLYPFWTVEALDRFGLEESFVPDADKSIGIIRGKLYEDSGLFSSEQLGKLLRLLERYAPEKALRHRLMLLRASPQPCTKETLDLDRDSLCPLTMSQILKEFLANYFQHPSKRHLCSHDQWDKEELQFLISIRTQFSLYCLSRLKLRKGEKAGSSSYKATQVVEQSSVWRQGYLKALSEIGINLEGKVHRAVNFTRKFDPDEDVRSVAQDCYKAVRRGENKSPSAAEIKKGLTAAYWWLLLAQRQSLGAPINYEEARLTRRRLLRHP